MNTGLGNAGVLSSKAASGASYLVYTAKPTQGGTNAPTMDVVYQNTIGDIIWSYVETGIYRGTLVGAFPEGKVPTLSGYIRQLDSGSAVWGTFWESNDSVILKSINGNGGNAADDMFDAGNTSQTPIEIRVYP